MNNRYGKRKAMSLLLVLAMLVVSVATLLPITASAGTDPIEDFSYQTLKGATMLDDTTDLRFVFTVNSLDYEWVGVILSKTVETPTYDAANCYTHKMTTVYSTITADGQPQAASTGRFWVACKMTDVPYSYFDGALYIRAFVKEAGQDPVYSDTEMLTVNRALVFNSKSPAGHTFYDNGNDFTFGKKVIDIRGSSHFYPTTDNPSGNDFWFEYSFLWNDTLHNWDVKSSLAEMKVACFRDPAVWDTHREFYFLYMRDKNDPFFTSNDCPFMGHFDYSTYKSDDLGKNNAVDLTSEGNTLFGDTIGQYVAGWGSNPKQRSYSPYIFDSEKTSGGFGRGWHRIGFRYHQEATANGNTVSYSAYTELYIDGVKVWKVLTNTDTLKNKGSGLLLWTASTTAEEGYELGANGLYYKDNDNMRIEARLGEIIKSTNAVYIGAGDVAWTCGNGFQMSVSPIAVGDLVARNITLADGVTVSGMFYYTEN